MKVGSQEGLEVASSFVPEIFLLKICLLKWYILGLPEVWHGWGKNIYNHSLHKYKHYLTRFDYLHGTEYTARNNINSETPRLP